MLFCVTNQVAQDLFGSVALIHTILIESFVIFISYSNILCLIQSFVSIIFILLSTDSFFIMYSFNLCIQGDLEKELGLPISPLCDRESTVIPQSQIG